MKAGEESTRILREALDRLDQVHAALSGAVDLLQPATPRCDLHAASRENVGTLFALLLECQAEARARAWTAFLAERAQP